MPDQQLSTIANTELQELDPYESLEKDDYKTAVDLRLVFWKYNQIAEKLKVKEQTIREWFSINGKCRQADDYRLAQRAKENEEMNASVRKELQDMTIEAVQVVREALKEKNPATAFAILAINGIAPTQSMILDIRNKEKVEKFDSFLDKVADDHRQRTAVSNS